MLSKSNHSHPFATDVLEYPWAQGTRMGNIHGANEFGAKSVGFVLLFRN